MKLSRATTYALYGLSYIAGQPKGRHVPLSEIHAHYGVPEKHLAKIFQQFVKTGILSSARGVHGGFALLKPPEEISVLLVIETVEGSVNTSSCLLVQESCEMDTICQINDLWRRAQNKMLDVLRDATLVDIIQAPRPRPKGSLPVTQARAL